MPVSQADSMALDAAIGALTDYRKYHSNLVPELANLLSSVHSSILSSATQQAQLNKYSDVDAVIFCKQVKRLFNQCLCTLTKWSELLDAPDTSDVVPQESSTIVSTSHYQTLSGPTSSTSSSSSMSTHTSAIVAKQKPTIGSLSRLGSRTTTATVRTRGQVPTAEDTQAQRRVGMMRGAKARAETPKTTNHMEIKTSTTNAKGSTTGVATPQIQHPIALTKTSISAKMTTKSNVSDLASHDRAIYDTDRPTYSHAAILVDVGFLGIRTLEVMDKNVPNNLFEVEKARSNLISKIIQLGMKRRALHELGFLRAQLFQCAMSLWNEPDFDYGCEHHKVTADYKSILSSSPESIKETYRHLFTFPFPKALSNFLAELAPDTMPSSDTRLDQALTFCRLIQALHTNALRCWIDVRNGSLAHLLPDMTSQKNSSFDWCMCIARLNRSAGQQSLDTIFRLFFIAAGKALGSNPSRALTERNIMDTEGQRNAFMLRMHGIRYHGAYRHLIETKDDMIWDKLLRCGAEYEKSTREGRSNEDILFLVSLYKTTFEFLKNLSSIDYASLRFQEWRRHLAFFTRKLDNKGLNEFVDSIPCGDQDMEMTEALDKTKAEQTMQLIQYKTPEAIASDAITKLAPATCSATAQAASLNTISVEQFSNRLDDAVRALKKFDDALQGWHSRSLKENFVENCVMDAKAMLLSLERDLPSAPTENMSAPVLQNMARIFRFMDTIRSIGSKFMDASEKVAFSQNSHAPLKGISMDRLQWWLSFVQDITKILSDLTAALWHRLHVDYLSNFNIAHAIKTATILTCLESAFTLAKEMNDDESLPWISNALYNLGGALFKAGRRSEAIRPLEIAVECYSAWLQDDLSTDRSLENIESSRSELRSRSAERLVLANRYEVLGVCLQAADDLSGALKCFNSGLCVLPLNAFLAIDAAMMGGLNVSQLPAAKLLNRRARILLMMEGSRFSSIVTVPEFESKVMQPDVPVHICGIVQEFECRILGVLSVKTNYTNQCSEEQIEVLRHLITRVYRGGQGMMNPIRRARVLIQLAMLYQSRPEIDLQQEAPHLVEEAVEILKEKDLKADLALEPVRNHHLALAYSWNGVLDRCRGDGLLRRSKPFQIALQLWELILGKIECFTSTEDSRLINHQLEVDKIRKQLPEPEFLYDHLQMLADCLGMIDYHVLQVQVYLLMLKLCNGVMTTIENTCGGEMARIPRDSSLSGGAYATWLLIHSLYLMSVGLKTQGVATYNQARYHSEQHYVSNSHHESIESNSSKIGMLSRKVEIKFQRAIVIVEAYLARSQLLLHEGDLSEAILDSKRAGRQLSRIVTTLSTAIKSARMDPNIVTRQPIENPFLVRPQTTIPSETQTQDPTMNESRQLWQTLEKLITQRYQWIIFRLLIETYHQLGRLYLVQGSAREADYFFNEGRHIAQLSKSGKSIGRFMLEQAELKLRRHEWKESQQILQELDMWGEESNASALVWEIKDVKIQLLNGDLYFANQELKQSLKAYCFADEVLTHLMDKAFISELEHLVIREPQTPRESRLTTVNGLQGANIRGILRPQIEGLYEGGLGMSDQAQFECVALAGIKATMGYRSGLILGLNGRRAEAFTMIERSKAEDPVALTIEEYHLTKAKVLILELEDTMSKNLLYAMMPDSALSIGLFRKLQIQDLVSPTTLFNQSFIHSDNGVLRSLNTKQESLLSSPSVRVTKMTRHHQSQLKYETTLQSPSKQRSSRKHQKGTQKGLGDHCRELMKQAHENLMAAYHCMIKAHSPHTISEVCLKQIYLSVLESCFCQETALNGKQNEHIDTINHDMAVRAACYLEMAKAITQHREMHSLIRQKLNPEALYNDQTWPSEIQLQVNNPESSLPQLCDFRLDNERSTQQQLGPKTVHLVGLEKPRRLRLIADDDRNDDQEFADVDVNMGSCQDDENAKADEDNDLRNVGMRPEDLLTRCGRREYYDRQSKLHSSTSFGNERPILEIMDKIYSDDTQVINGQSDTFQKRYIDILPKKWTVVSLSMDVEREVNQEHEINIERDVLYVNRMRAGATPLVLRLPLNRGYQREDDHQNLGFGVAMGFDEEESTPVEPLSFKKAVKEFQDIMLSSQETLAQTSSKQHSAATSSVKFAQAPMELTREAKAEWWRQRQRLDERLYTLLCLIQDQWLGGLKGIIQSHNTPVNEENLMNFKRALEWIMSQAVHSMSTASTGAEAGTPDQDESTAASSKDSILQLEINVDLCRVILNLGDQPSFTELKDLIYFLLDAYLYNGAVPSASTCTPLYGPSPTSASSSPIIEYSEVQFGKIALQIKKALCCYWEAETEAKNNGFDDGAHVILILDKHLQIFPWESCPVLREEAVSRVPSIWFLRDRILQQKYCIFKGSQHERRNEGHSSLTRLNEANAADELQSIMGCEWQDLVVDPQKTFYILNPGGDLKNTEDEFKEYVESQQGWGGVTGRAPLDLECINGLSKHDLYIYFGHSGGEQYIRSTQIRQLGHCAVSLLLGCSSGCLKGDGEFDPTGNVMNYLLAGCPTIVANLWDVTDKDLDRFSMATFQMWGLDRNRSYMASFEEKPNYMEQGLDDVIAEGLDNLEEGKIELKSYDDCEPQLSLVEAVKEAREKCKLKYLVGAASVVYGIPCFLKSYGV
ncbi:hypothetical protein BX616_009980 [Lobosporangium transversale]|nr:hypothetical protein BX616_009980 [Lobosporangium transversale]